MALKRPSAYPAFDRFFDEAHELEACGCDDCGRVGWQLAPTKDGKAFWASFVFIDKQGRIHRAEQDGDTYEQAVARLLATEFDRDA